MENRVSIIKLLGLPETFAVVLLTFSFILFLAPYFSGADFGLFKIPQFTGPAQKKLKIIGPMIFVILVMLFVPMIPSHSSVPSGNANRSDTEGDQTKGNNGHSKNDSNLSPPVDIHAQAQQHIERAENLYNLKQYDEAIKEYDEAISLEPGNQEAIKRREHIKVSLEISKRNQ